MSPPLVLPSSSTAEGVTRRAYRQRLARMLGMFVTGTVTTQAASLEAERYVISTSIKSSMARAEHYDGMFVYVTNGDEEATQRAAQNGTFDGPLGALKVDADYESGPLANGTTFEISVMPADPYLGVDGLNDIINEALELLPVIDKVQVTAVSDQLNYSFANFAWPVTGVRDVFGSRTSTTTERRRAVSRATWAFEHDAESPVLSFGCLPCGSGDVFEVEVMRSAKSRIRQDGAWGDSLTGLTDDDDQALYSAQAVAVAAYPIALERMALQYGGGTKERDSLDSRASSARMTAGLTRWYGDFRGNGAQRVGASGGR